MPILFGRNFVTALHKIQSFQTKNKLYSCMKWRAYIAFSNFTKATLLVSQTYDLIACATASRVLIIFWFVVCTDIFCSTINRNGRYSSLLVIIMNFLCNNWRSLISNNDPVFYIFWVNVELRFYWYLFYSYKKIYSFI